MTMIFFVAIAFCVSITPVNAETQKEKDLASILSQKLAGLVTFQGDFKQVITDEDHDVVEENDGEFLLKRPGFFRWYINPPFEKLMVSNNKTMWTYDPDLKQATADVVDDRLLQTPMLILSGDLEQIRINYEIFSSAGDIATNNSDDTSNHQEVIVYKLIPKNDESLFEWMEILFVDDQVVGMTLLSELGEKQQYTFSNTLQNKNIPESTFSFDIPPDVDVIVND